MHLSTSVGDRLGGVLPVGYPTELRRWSGKRGPRCPGVSASVSASRGPVEPAPVLLVDEATSALDTENEAAVVDALTDDLRARTRAIVAHRLATIRPADRVLFVDGGRVLEDGTIDELLAAGGRFGEFWNQQRAAADWHAAAD
ncbi:MAG: ATP-binding cassette, subfamily bacterial IrtB/YbtQ [Mycobacterium sp.]|nr:ATP-binding cassette, subfamily bacterial IrtB/YbtQ [Mycobacterium sp.]